MLKKENSLRKKKEIDFVFKNGKAFYSDFSTFKFIENKTELRRICIIISAKVSKKAVIRNKNKRQIRAIFLKLKPFLKEGFDCLFIVKTPFLKKNYLDKSSLIQNIFKNSNLFKK